MEALAKVRFVRMSPRKARLVADLVRGKKVADALSILRFTNKKPAKIIEKVINSAKANAEEKNVDNPEEMRIETIFVDKGPMIKRMFPRARGRADILHKPLSHVTVILSDKPDEKKEEKPEVTEKKATQKGPARAGKAKAAVKKTAKKSSKKTVAKKE